MMIPMGPMGYNLVAATWDAPHSCHQTLSSNVWQLTNDRQLMMRTCKISPFFGQPGKGFSYICLWENSSSFFDSSPATIPEIHIQVITIKK